jgi:6-pyruvoyl-tetrahydropterin synthase
LISNRVADVKIMDQEHRIKHENMFEVAVSKESFKFNAAHFVAYRGFRERLHGHNYKLHIRLIGSRQIGQDGYVLDFGELKAEAKKVCKSLNEFFICPTHSDVITITEDEEGKNVDLICEDGCKFSIPKSDCAMLPIVHSTVEEIAIYCWGQILLGLNAKYLRKRGITTMEVTCSEATGQEALFRMGIPDTDNQQDILDACDVKSYIMSGELFPKPCLPIDKKNGVLSKDKKNKDCGCPHCGR